MGETERDRNFRQGGWLYQCKECGLWQNGPFKNRRDVSLKEFQAAVEPIWGRRPEGHMHPPRGSYSGLPLLHPEGQVYQEGSFEEKYGGTLCPECAQRASAHNRERIANLHRKMQEAPPEPAEALEKPKAPEPPAAEEKKGEGE